MDGHRRILYNKVHKINKKNISEESKDILKKQAMNEYKDICRILKTN